MENSKKYTRRQVLDLGARAVTSASLAGILKLDLYPERKLVIIHLSGGNDALNTVVPYTDRNYYRARKSLALKSDELIKIDNKYGLHPALKSLSPVFRRGDMAIILGVGYPEPSMSHELSGNIYKSGVVDGSSSNFWFENKSNGPDSGFVSKQLSLLNQTAGSLKVNTEHIEIDGFDTHTNHLARHAKALGKFADIVSDILNKQSKDCLIYAYSEFGRAIIPNDDGGLDHGVAGLSILLGANVKGGIYGGYGNLNKKLGEDYIDMALDFRAVLSQLV